MANVATLTAKMAMDISDFMSKTKVVGSGLNKLKGDAGNASAGMGKMFTAITAGSIASAAALKTVSVATRAIGMAFNEIGRGFKLAAAAETAESGFKVMLGSAEKAKAMMKDLQSFALATPFSTEGTHDVASTMLGVGVAEAKLIPAMRMLGDLSSGNTEKLKGLAVVYGQVQSKGKLLAQDFNQIAERGINMRQVLANEVGVSVKDLAKTMEAGKITFKDFHNAMVELSQTKYKGMLDEKNKTMQGAIDRIAEVRDSFARDVAMGIGKELGLTGSAGDLANFAEGLSVKAVPDFIAGLAVATDYLLKLADGAQGLAILLNPTSGAKVSDLGPLEWNGGMPGWKIGNGQGLGSQMAGDAPSKLFIKYLEEIKRAGAEAVKNKPPLPNAQRMPLDWQDVIKGVGRLGGMAAEMIGNDGSMLSSIGGRVGNAFGSVSDRFAVGGRVQEQRPTGALVAGSSESFSAIIRSMTGRDRESTAKASLAELKAISKAAGDTVEALGKILEKAATGVISSFAEG